MHLSYWMQVPSGLVRKEHHPAINARWAFVKAGYSSTYLISTKGVAYACGQNGNGQLGTGNFNNTVCHFDLRCTCGSYCACTECSCCVRSHCAEHLHEGDR